MDFWAERPAEYCGHSLVFKEEYSGAFERSSILGVETKLQRRRADRACQVRHGVARGGVGVARRGGELVALGQERKAQHSYLMPGAQVDAGGTWWGEDDHHS